MQLLGCFFKKIGSFLQLIKTSMDWTGLALVFFRKKKTLFPGSRST